MSLLDKIRDDFDHRLISKEAERVEADRARQQRVIELEGIVRDAVQKVAEELGEEFRTVEMGYVYRIGDIIVYIELFERYNPELPDPDKPSLAVMSYLVWLVGVDKRSGHLDKVRLGTLKFLNYQGLYDTIVKAPSYMELKADAVLLHTDELKALR